MSIVSSAKDFFFARLFANGFHKRLFKSSNGRFGSVGFGMPVVMLTTTGRKSGKRRETMLTSPVQDGDKIVLVASWGGDDRHPTWYLNLRDEPKVEVMFKGSTRPMTARTATPEEKAELWPRITAKYRGYGGYQKRTDRDIPVVILEP
jgi:deazaflavin-dependent oxidoreductase (nitroreductase family)